MKLGLELMAAVGPHRMNPKRELCDHVVEKTYGVRLGVARVNLEGPDAGGIVDGGVLIATYRPATWADELQERDIDLDVMAGDLLGVAMRVHRSTATLLIARRIRRLVQQDLLYSPVVHIGDVQRVLRPA